jgi:hypothetical protein
MSDHAANSSSPEERLIFEAQSEFGNFFRWISTLDAMIKKDIGPSFGLIVNNPDVDVAEHKVSGTLDISRPMKPVLSIPFAIQGNVISLDHPKFEMTDDASGKKTFKFTSRASDDVNRILGTIVQDYIA